MERDGKRDGYETTLKLECTRLVYVAPWHDRSMIPRCLLSPLDGECLSELRR